MGILQKSALWIVVFGFIGIVGYELYGRAIKYKAIQDAKHRRFLKQLEKEE